MARDHLVSGVIQSRWHRRGDAAFGKPFSYTDAYDLTGDFADPGKSGLYTRGAVKLAWYQKLWRKLTAKKPPLGYVVVDYDNNVPTAQIMAKAGEVKVSPIEPRAIFPVWGEDYILAVEQYEKEHPSV